MQYVFIIGIARTGSKIYKNILNEWSDIHVSNELHFLFPPWIMKDFRTYVDEKIGNLKIDSNIPPLINLMYSGALNGTFWKGEIHNINREKLEKRILESDRSYRSIFKILVEESAKAKNKKIAGAKFPVNIVYVPTLVQWFPNAKFVHIIRDPRAIYVSMVLKDIKNFNVKSKIVKFIIALGRLIYLIWQFKMAAKIHRKYRNWDNYYLSRFEDIVSEPEIYLRRLCKFLEIEFKEEMLYPPVVDSSYYQKKNKGFDKDALIRWKNHISPITERIITLILKKEMKEFGYI